MSRRRRTNTARNALGLALIAIAGLALFGLAALSLWMRPPPTDPETLCRTDAPLPAHTIVLVDSTDRLEARHRRKLRAVLAQERERLSRYEMLTIMRISARRPQEPSILFSRCLPQPPEDANPLFQNARIARERWDEAFGQALDSALRSAGAGGGARTSPIVAGVRAVAADPNFGAEVPARRLVLVSDLLEHSPDGFSLYARGADYGAWIASAPAGPPDLAQVDVRVVPLDRPDHAESQAFARETFWPAFFDAADARSVTVDPAP